MGDGAGLYLLIAGLRADIVKRLVGVQMEYQRAGNTADSQLADLRREALRVGRAGQLFAEGVQAEAVMDALQQDSAGFGIALQDQDVADAFFICADRRRHAGAAAADNH